jgi:NADH-quinone oxidoreductase subunit H
MLMNIIDILVQSLLTILPLFLAVAIFTLMERKMMGAIQRRRGPSILGF